MLEKASWLLTELRCSRLSALDQELLLGPLEDAARAHPLHHPSKVPYATLLVSISETTQPAPGTGARRGRVASQLGH